MKRLSVVAACAVALIVTVFVTSSAGQGDLLTLVGPGAAIGVTVEDLPSEEAAKLKVESGVRIGNVRDGAPAARAGMKNGDVVVEFDGERVRGVTQFTRLVRETPPKRTVRTTVVRDGARQTLNITPEPGGQGWNTFQFTPKQVEPFATTPRSTPFQSGRLFVNPSEVQLGVSISALDGQLATYFGVKQGVLVTSVEAGTPAATAGMKAGDVITTIGGRTIEQPAQVVDAVRAAQPGSGLEIKIVRDKKEMTLKVTIRN